MAVPRTLIYKRTHPGDPSPDGIFGLEDCMGRVRARDFQAAIGVGGTSAEPRSYGMDRRLNWVGVGARPLKGQPFGFRGPLVTFDRFILLENDGPRLSEIAPALARHLYGRNRRVVMSDGLNETLLHEIANLLELARDALQAGNKLRSARQRQLCRRPTCK
jgi:hypothetical protein